MEDNREIVIAGSHGIFFPPMQMDVSWTSGNISQGFVLDEGNVFQGSIGHWSIKIFSRFQIGMGKDDSAIFQLHPFSCFSPII